MVREARADGVNQQQSTQHVPLDKLDDSSHVYTISYQEENGVNPDVTGTTLPNKDIHHETQPSTVDIHGGAKITLYGSADVATIGHELSHAQDADDRAGQTLEWDHYLDCFPPGYKGVNFHNNSGGGRRANQAGAAAKASCK
jgi:hypothetical protein